MIWGISERLSVNFGYDTTVRDYVNRNEEADANAIYVGFNYRGASRIP